MTERYKNKPSWSKPGVHSPGGNSGVGRRKRNIRSGARPSQKKALDQRRKQRPLSPYTGLPRSKGPSRRKVGRAVAFANFLQEFANGNDPLSDFIPSGTQYGGYDTATGLPVGEPGPVTQQSPLVGEPGDGAGAWGHNMPHSDGFYYAASAPFGGNGWTVAVSRPVLARIHNEGKQSVWDPHYFGAAGGAQVTTTLLATLGSVVDSPGAWNFYEVFGSFAQSPIGISAQMAVNPSPQLGPFVWAGQTARSNVSLANAIAQLANTRVKTEGASAMGPATTVNPKRAPVAFVAPAPRFVPHAQIANKMAYDQVRGDLIIDDPSTWSPPGKDEPTPYHPPPPKEPTKEKKFGTRSGKLFRIAQGVFHAGTEGKDFMDALFDALPANLRRGAKSPVDKLDRLYRHWDKVDLTDALVNLMYNKVEDDSLGKFFAQVDKAAKRLNMPSYKIDNSITGGPSDGLFEAYGAFSREYANPSRENLKNWLNSLD